jgi:hypothetical protein
MNTSTHALDAAACVGNVEISVRAELLSPCCKRRIRSFHYRETSDGVAVACERCHVDVFTAENGS